MEKPYHAPQFFFGAALLGVGAHTSFDRERMFPKTFRLRELSQEFPSCV
jgi:hypothetical protein